MNSIDEKNIAEIKEYAHSLEKLNPTNYQKNRFLIMNCFGKCIQIIEKNAALREQQERYIASMEEMKERYPYSAEEIRPHQEDYKAVCDQCGGRNTWMIGNYINCGDCQTSKKQTDR